MTTATTTAKKKSSRRESRVVGRGERNFLSLPVRWVKTGHNLPVRCMPIYGNNKKESNPMTTTTSEDDGAGVDGRVRIVKDVIGVTRTTTMSDNNHADNRIDIAV